MRGFGRRRGGGLLRRLLRGWTTLVVSIALSVGGAVFEPADAPAPEPPGLSGWTAQRVAGRPLPHPLRDRPERVAGFFAELDTAQRGVLAMNYPEIVGNLDGVPLDLRLRVNAARSSRSPQRQLLVYDPRGDGRIAEVFGDLTTADRIAVLVPGVSGRIANFDRGLGGHQRRSPSWQARQIQEQAQSLDPAARTAVVAWLGYDPPEGFGRDAIREERAAAGATALVRFVEGLVTYRPGTTVAVVGHSYGSVVVGRAARSLRPQVTDIVAVGSPGMGVGNVRELRTAARVWAGSAPSDWTRRVPGVRMLGAGHGTRPTDASFGARRLATSNVDDHDGYFVPGTASLRQLGGILLGRPEAAGATP